MSNINLRTCTKEDLRKSLMTVINKAKVNTYVLLEDIYTDKPSVIYTTDYKRKNNAFGEINVNMNILISRLEDKEGYREDPEKFINDLYNYIEEEYR